MTKIKHLCAFFFLAILLVACSGSEPTANPEPTLTKPSNTAESTATTLSTSPTEEGESYPPPVSTLRPYPAPTQDTPGYPAPPAEPEAITFPSLDGTLLAGMYYAPYNPPAPVVVLMHQYGSDQHQWDGMALWLQTGIAPVGIDWLPALPEGLTFAVFTFDFRGHGDSEGNSSSDDGFLLDAQSALAYVKTQPGVDPNRIITIGTSIGADSAVDACISLNEGDIAENQETQGCLGAMPISPGGFVGVNYTRAAETFSGDPHFAVVYCIAAEGDSSAPLLCNSASGNRYKAVIYPGSGHGLALLKPGLDPDMGNVILEFLLESLELRQ